MIAHVGGMPVEETLLPLLRLVERRRPDLVLVDIKLGLRDTPAYDRRVVAVLTFLHRVASSTQPNDGALSVGATDDE